MSSSITLMGLSAFQASAHSVGSPTVSYAPWQGVNPYERSWFSWDHSLYSSCLVGRKHRGSMEENHNLLKSFESDNRDTVEAVEDELKSQIASKQCVAIRGECRTVDNRMLSSGVEPTCIQFSLPWVASLPAVIIRDGERGRGSMQNMLGFGVPGRCTRRAQITPKT